MSPAPVTVAAGVFADRADAGRRLAVLLGPQPMTGPVVVGMARGGSAGGRRGGRVLGAPLDVVVVRKLGHPGQPELGSGALGEDGVRVVNERLVARLGVPAERDRGGGPARDGRARTPAAPLPGRPAAGVGDRAGSWRWWTTDWPRGSPPGRRSRSCAVAAPDGSWWPCPSGRREAVASLEEVADEVVCVETAGRFFGISEWYGTSNR